jgi:hypothetical protein
VESLETMDIPFRRIVALTAIGLVTGALLRLIYKALEEMQSKPDALKGGALATFEVEVERFRVWTTNPQTIHDLHELQRARAQPTSQTGVSCADPDEPDTTLPTTGTLIHRT